MNEKEVEKQPPKPRDFQIKQQFPNHLSMTRNSQKNPLGSRLLLPQCTEEEMVPKRQDHDSKGTSLACGSSKF